MSFLPCCYGTKSKLRKRHLLFINIQIFLAALKQTWSMLRKTPAKSAITSTSAWFFWKADWNCSHSSISLSSHFFVWHPKRTRAPSSCRKTQIQPQSKLESWPCTPKFRRSTIVVIVYCTTSWDVRRHLLVLKPKHFAANYNEDFIETTGEIGNRKNSGLSQTESFLTFLYGGQAIRAERHLIVIKNPNRYWDCDFI